MLNLFYKYYSSFHWKKICFIKGGEGTSLEDVSEKDKETCCLSDAMALRLGNVAIQVKSTQWLLQMHAWLFIFIYTLFSYCR